MGVDLSRIRKAVGRAREAGSAPDSTMTEGLVRALDSNERFRRDGWLSGIFHPGRISFREISPEDSLHIIIDGSKVSAHVDDVCPLRCGPDGEVKYSWTRVLAHNLSGSAADLGRRLHGRHGEQRCSLGCEIVWVEDDQIADLAADLRDGSISKALRPNKCD